MKEIEFNLLDEPWICVIKKDGGQEEVSLLDVFRKAPGILRLAGELPVQDIAVLRLLLAILHAVFSRYDLNGNWAPIFFPDASPDDALMRWRALWENGEFPMQILEEYLLHYRERFWLFHPERPFYQVPGLMKATEYGAAKINGELSESNNKIRLFPQRTGRWKKRLQYNEAARWLLYLNAFDDSSGKASIRGANMESPGVGWLGKISPIMAVGNNLFETLMLNLVLLKDGENQLWGKEQPVWEAEKVNTEERVPIPLPDNLSELYTLQSRRLLLLRENDLVTGCLLLGGDFFKKEANAFCEQMTAWNASVKKAGVIPEYMPKRHDPSKQLWRDFSALVAQGGAHRRPGIVSWLARLAEENLIPQTHFRLQTVAVQYGDKNSSIEDTFSDSISINIGLLTSLGTAWVNRILDELEITDKLVNQVGFLAQALAKASGNAKGTDEAIAAKEQAYYRLDMPFRAWLEQIDPKQSEMDEACDRWWAEATRIVRGLGRELAGQAGPQAFAGRVYTENNKERRYSAPEAYNRFLYKTSSRKALLAGGRNG